MKVVFVVGFGGLTFETKLPSSAKGSFFTPAKLLADEARVMSTGIGFNTGFEATSFDEKSPNGLSPDDLTGCDFEAAIALRLLVE